MGERIVRFLLPVVGVGFLLLVWTVLSVNVQDLPSPLKTWEESKVYILQPLEKRGEMDQGIVRLASYSLIRVAKGFLLGVLIATPLGFILGLSKVFNAFTAGAVSTSPVTLLIAPPQIDVVISAA